MSDEQQQPEQEQPKFPMTNFNLLPNGNGLIITTFLTPDLQITKFVNNEQLDQIYAGRKQIQKQQHQELQLIQDIKNNKGRENLKLLNSKGLN